MLRQQQWSSSFSSSTLSPSLFPSTLKHQPPHCPAWAHLVLQKSRTILESSPSTEYRAAAASTTWLVSAKSVQMQAVRQGLAWLSFPSHQMEPCPASASFISPMPLPLWVRNTPSPLLMLDCCKSAQGFAGDGGKAAPRKGVSSPSLSQLTDLLLVVGMGPLWGRGQDGAGEPSLERRPLERKWASLLHVHYSNSVLRVKSPPEQYKISIIPQLFLLLFS